MPITTALKGTVRSIGRLSRRSKLHLAWDVFMVWVALVNLWMIIFDLSYLWLRPLYFEYVPVVTRIYDPVKGIEPHPLTEELLTRLELTEAGIRRASGPAAVEADAQELRDLSYRLVIEDPFERSGQNASLNYISEAFARNIGVSAGALRDPTVLRRATNAFWPSDPESLLETIEEIDPRIIHALEINYHRGYNIDGKLIDHFWILDLPFLVLFWIEFSVRWIHALRHRTYARWFFFPIFNWYDVLGLIPVAVFRPFRLLRAVSMYMRLQRSELSSVGKDIFTRTVLYLSNIITEEVSDRVAIRILSEFHEEIEEGTHSRIASSVIEPRKHEIENVVAAQIRQTLTNEETLNRLRDLVRLNLEHAVDDSEALRSVPLPNVVLKPAVRAVGEVILDATLETVDATFNSPEGEDAVREVAAAVIGDVFHGPGLAQLEALVKEITLQVLEHMMDVVQVKKWALPEDQEKRPLMPWEPGALDAPDPEQDTVVEGDDDPEIPAEL